MLLIGEDVLVTADAHYGLDSIMQVRQSSKQPHPLRARVRVLSDDKVVMHQLRPRMSGETHQFVIAARLAKIRCLAQRDLLVFCCWCGRRTFKGTQSTVGRVAADLLKPLPGNAVPLFVAPSRATLLTA